MTATTIPDTAKAAEQVLRTLTAPRRNQYYYGKLLEVRHFQMEQWYALHKRWLLNRLTLGAGVLCGLEPTLGADGSIRFSPGVAIDGLGREIVVTEPFVIDPTQPRDDLGREAGDRLVGGDSTILLCYTECPDEATQISVADCAGRAASAYSAIVERYRVIVRAGLPSPPGELSDAQRDAIFPDAPPTDRSRLAAAEEALAIGCAPRDESCVVIATATLQVDGAPIVVDAYGFRPEVFSNTVLFELIAALAARVDACCGGVAPSPGADTVVIESGDDQTAQVGAVLPDPVVVLVRRGDGNPADGATVTLSTNDPGGLLTTDATPGTSSITAVTDPDGRVAVRWRLGTEAGGQRIAVTHDGGAAVRAHATATAAPIDPPPVDEPPVVLRTRPENGEDRPDWREAPELTVVFDQPMDPEGLADPERWLRAWYFQNFGHGEYTAARRLLFAPADPPEGAEVVFRAEPFAAQEPGGPAVTVVVLMRGRAPQIVSAGAGVALDAEFRGTELDDDQLDRLWTEGEFQPDDAFGDRVTATGASLPSGDHTAGGEYFHSTFTTSAG